MKELIVISGKGGTGKTSLMAAFSSLAENKVLCDADVDAADLHLIMDPEVVRRTEFQSGNSAVINNDLCTECGLCREMCRFNAISADYIVNPIDCEGCGVCVHFCPETAIDFPVNTCGEWFVSDTRFGPLVHARLGIAEENSGKLVSTVRKEAAAIAIQQDLEMILIDGSPGIGCPVIASITGADAVLVVVEPTLSGMHDMKRALELAGYFGVKAMLAVNRFDINEDIAAEIIEYAAGNGIHLAGRVRYDPDVTRAQINGMSVVEYSDGPAASDIRRLWKAVVDELDLEV